ncbi:MAG: TonB-dependent receptor [Bacteroidia bacterium]
MLKPALKFFFILISFQAIAQQQDSVPFYIEGSITERIIGLNEVLIKPACACVGECSCKPTTKENYSLNRFSATDALLEKNNRISLIKRGNFAFEPVLNGMASDRINLTIDGMKIFGACTDKMDPITSYVEPNNMKSISVQHGAAGSMFGSGIGGSVNMETNGAVINPAKKLSGEAGMGFHSASMGMNGLFMLNYSSKRWALMTNGVYRRFQNYRAGGGEIINYTQFEKWNGSVSGKYMPTDNDVLRFDVIIDEGYNIGYAALPMDVLYAKAKIFGLTYQHLPCHGAIEKIEVKLYGNTVSHSMDDTKRTNVAIHMDMPGNTKTFGGYFDTQLKKNKHKVTLRLDGYHNNARAEMTMYPVNEAEMFMLTWPDVNKMDAGIFIQDVIDISEKNKLSFNVRLEYLNTRVIDEFGVQQASVFNQDVSKTNHRLLKVMSATYMRYVSKLVSAWLTAGYTERAPSLTEQYGFYIFNAYDGYDYVGNVNIKNEKAVQLDAGIQWKHEKVEIRCTGFYYRLFDYILGAQDNTMDAMTINANGVKFSKNIPEAFMTGGNLELTYSPVKMIKLSSASSYTHGEIAGGNPLPLIAPFKNISSLKWLHQRGFVLLECESAAAQNRINPEFGERTTADYSIINLRASYFFPINNKKITLNVGIENLLDKRYRTHLTWGGIPQQGINGYLNISFSF